VHAYVTVGPGIVTRRGCQDDPGIGGRDISQIVSRNTISEGCDLQNAKASGVCAVTR